MAVQTDDELSRLNKQAKKMLSGPSLIEWQRTAPVIYQRGQLDFLALPYLVHYCSRFGHKIYYQNQLLETADEKSSTELQALIDEATQDLKDICNEFSMPFDINGSMVLDENVTSLARKMPIPVAVEETSNLSPLVPLPHRCFLDGEALVEWNRVAAKLNAQHSLDDGDRRTILMMYCQEAGWLRTFEIDIAAAIEKGADKKDLQKVYRAVRNRARREAKRYATLLDAKYDRAGFVKV